MSLVHITRIAFAVMATSGMLTAVTKWGGDNGGDIPCPVCNRKEWLAFYRDEIIECGMEQAERKRGPKTVKYGGFPEPIRFDAKAMRSIRRLLRRGWYQGRKYYAKQLREGADK